MSHTVFTNNRVVRKGSRSVLLAGGAGLMLATALGCGQMPETNSHEDLVRKAQMVIVGSRIQAERWNSSLTTAGAVFNEGGGDGQSVAGLQVNEVIGYSGVNFGGGANQIQVRVGAPYAGGKAEIWADAVGSGTKLGTVAISSATGSDWNAFTTLTIATPTLSGTHNLFFKGVATGGDWLFKLDYFELHNTTGGGGTNPPPQTGKVPVVVTNKCPFPLSVILSGVGDIPLEKDSAGNKIYRNLGTGGSYTYYAPSNYPSGRVSAYRTLPSPSSPRELEKAEFTLGPDGNGVQNIYYNLTYVDHVGLPMQISTVGNNGCSMAQCNKSYSALSSAIANACPDGLRYNMGGGTICLAPRSFCLDGEYASDPRRGSVCNRLDSEIARCASKYPGQCNPGSAKTPQVYACSAPFFDQSAKWCSAITRGMVDNPDSTNVAQYYNTGKPYNQYAKWVHDQCGAVYSFAYDDYPMAANQAGFYTCNGGRQLNVTFCPAG
ncbi:beta-1,3-glucanase family protein [Cystobacter ferrugineus]|uniref:beta-1,3-glucanase family protein n=1 Tax=Cystobacter ferrugineus TaxID=83449 RepID=UPI000B08BC10|nr:beta-1,3-glucanase family protein [Cystobacter ferrugineus]